MMLRIWRSLAPSWVSHPAFSTVTGRNPLACLFPSCLLLTPSAFILSQFEYRSMCVRVCLLNASLLEWCSIDDILKVSSSTTKKHVDVTLGGFTHLAGNATGQVSAKLSILFTSKHWQAVHLHDLTVCHRKVLLGGRRNKLVWVVVNRPGCGEVQLHRDTIHIIKKKWANKINEDCLHCGVKGLNRGQAKPISQSGGVRCTQAQPSRHAIREYNGFTNHLSFKARESSLHQL